MADDIGELTQEEYLKRAAQQQQLSELEKGAQEAPKEEEKKEEKKEKSFLRKAFDLTYLTAASVGTTMLSSAFLGPLGFIVGGAFAGGGLIGSMVKGAKSVYESITDFLKTYSAVNAILAPMIWLGNVTFPIAGAIGSKIAGTVGAIATKSAYSLTAYNMAFTAQYKAAHHLVENYGNPIGITKTLKENYWPTVYRFGTGFSPGYVLAANGLDSIMGVPVFAANAVPMGIYNGINPIGEKKK
ncbi:MAG: hypothetical protein U9O94_04190 [Nanoarchaeota archaeon]|nr:hypothetical protein [Nanoarchaeota archaeon]